MVIVDVTKKMQKSETLASNRRDEMGEKGHCITSWKWRNT